MKGLERDSLAGILFHFALCLVAALAGLFFFADSYKVLTLLCAAAVVILLLTGRTDYLRHPVSLLLLGYVLVAGLSGVWAIAGKFFLKEYVKVFVAGCMFIGVLTWKRFERGTVRALFGGMSVVSAIYCFLNIEFVTTGIVRQWIESLIPTMATVDYGLHGNRVYGIFGTPNAMTTFVAFAIFFSIALLTDEKKKGLRMWWAAVLAINAFTFLTMFSLAGTCFFVMSTLVYLLTSGKKCGAVLAHMLIGAIPSVLWWAVSFSFFGSETQSYVPMLALLGNAVSVMVLELLFSGTLIPVLEKHGKIAMALLVVLIVGAGGFLTVAMNTSEAYTFGKQLQRAVYLEPGTHTINIQASGEVTCIVQYQNEKDAVMEKRTTLHNSSEPESTFEVPDDATVCYIILRGEPGIVLEEVVLDQNQPVHLKYTMLPDFVADRLQGFFANDSVTQRLAFFDDGMELFYQSPVVGLGVGSFETGLTSVQEHHYETKYVHNHYIQVLHECGVLGFIPYIGALLGLVFLLWKQRKKELPIIDGGFGALCAAMAMMLGHTTFEFSMSLVIFTCYAFITFAIIIRCALEPEEEAHPVYEATKKDRVLSIACCALVGVFSITLCLNLFANYLMHKPVANQHEFMENLAAAAGVDPYEKNDAMLSYVVSSVQSDQQHRYQAQADEFAAKLTKVQSNTIPNVLLQYYLQTGQPYAAVDAALAGARYSATDSDTWNNAANAFRNYLFRSMDSLLFREGKPLVDELLTYYENLKQHNAESLENIRLTLASKDFFGKLKSLASGEGTEEEFLVTLAAELFRLDTACDADQDSIPDQVNWYKNLTFNQDGTISTQENAVMLLDLYCESFGTAQIVVECEDPSAISVSSERFLSVKEQRVDDGYVVVEGDILLLDEGNTLQIYVNSARPQEITQIQILRIAK